MTIRSIREAIHTIKCDNILECFFGLNELDVLIYKCLINKPMRSQEIARIVKRGENAVYKSLQKLIICKLVLREKRCYENGGYYYVYVAVDPKKVAENMEREVRELEEKLIKAIEEFKNSYIL